MSVVLSVIVAATSSVLGSAAPEDQDPCPVQAAKEDKPDPDGLADFIDLYYYFLQYHCPETN